MAALCVAGLGQGRDGDPTVAVTRASGFGSRDTALCVAGLVQTRDGNRTVAATCASTLTRRTRPGVRRWVLSYGVWGGDFTSPHEMVA